MPDFSFYDERREALKKSYLTAVEATPQPLQTGGVDHLALICSELERTIEFYTELLGMRLTRIVPLPITSRVKNFASRGERSTHEPADHAMGGKRGWRRASSALSSEMMHVD